MRFTELDVYPLNWVLTLLADAETDDLGGPPPLSRDWKDGGPEDVPVSRTQHLSETRLTGRHVGYQNHPRSPRKGRGQHDEHGQ